MLQLFACRTQRKGLQVNNCGKKHHTLLHDDTLSSQKPVNSNAKSSGSNGPGVSNVHANFISPNIENYPVRLIVVPVKVSANDSDCYSFTYAFLDYGSSRSFCTTDIAKSLGLQGETEGCTIHTASGSKPHSGKRVSFTITGINEPNEICINNILTFDGIPDLRDSIPHQEIVEQYPHLHGLSFPEVNGTIKVLIGSDVLGQFPISDTCVGEQGSPTAYHTMLGWALAGPDKNAQISNCVDVNFLKAGYSYANSIEEITNLSMCHICGHDFVDLFADPCTTEFSVDDKKALSIMADTVKMVNGPFNTNTLVGVLLRFRQEPVAVICDISQMFHRIRVNPPDCDSMRFLWWPNDDLSRDPVELKMLSHIFGCKSSPSVATFALRKVADNNLSNADSVTIETVNRNFFVDDCLKSLPTADQTVSLISQLRKLLDTCGFHLAKFISNDQAVLDSIPDEDKAFKPADFTPTEVQLHLFCNASRVGYGCSSYLRMIDAANNIHVVFVRGVSRVTPKQPITIPRLEVVSAVAAAELARSIVKELDYKIDKVLYCTESTSVLQFLNNRAERFKTFVANGVNTIHLLSKPEQWLHVSTKENLADIASRGLMPNKVSLSNLWFDGPEFLRKDESFWPARPCNVPISGDNCPIASEFRVNYLSTDCEYESPFPPFFIRYSKFEKLQRAMVWLMRFQGYMRWKYLKCDRVPASRFISVEELRNAS
ncbi:uncharacterized protein LOC144421943 [Styela clava]